MSKYKINDIVKCQVTGVEKYGIFVSVDEKYTGLIHISEISDGFVRDVHDYVNVGDIINAIILEIDENDSKLKLTIKNINYNNKNQASGIKADVEGFQPLKEHLDIWINEKLNDYRKD